MSKKKAIEDQKGGSILFSSTNLPKKPNVPSSNLSGFGWNIQLDIKTRFSSLLITNTKDKSLLNGFISWSAQSKSYYLKKKKKSKIFKFKGSVQYAKTAMDTKKFEDLIKRLISTKMFKIELQPEHQLGPKLITRQFVIMGKTKQVLDAITEEIASNSQTLTLGKKVKKPKKSKVDDKSDTPSKKAKKSTKAKVEAKPTKVKKDKKVKSSESKVEAKPTKEKKVKKPTKAKVEAKVKKPTKTKVEAKPAITKGVRVVAEISKGEFFAGVVTMLRQNKAYILLDSGEKTNLPARSKKLYIATTARQRKTAIPIAQIAKWLN